MIRYIQNECLENMFCMYLFYYYRKKVGVVVIKEDLSIMDKLTINLMLQSMMYRVRQVALNVVTMVKA